MRQARTGVAIPDLPAGRRDERLRLRERREEQALADAALLDVDAISEFSVIDSRGDSHFLMVFGFRRYSYRFGQVLETAVRQRFPISA